MKTRENNLKKYIKDSLDLTKNNVIVSKTENYKKSNYYEEIFKIYKELGGRLADIPINIQSRHLDFVLNGAIFEYEYRIACLIKNKYLWGIH
jgi:hypothetical protein